MLKKLKYIPMVMLPVAATMFGVLSVKTLTDRQNPYDTDLAGTLIPTFDEIELPFDQQHSDDTSLSFTASAAIDIDGDGVEELFIGGGYQQENVLYRFENGGFVEIAGVAGITKSADGTSLSALVLDANVDGQADLIVSSREGITLFTNKDGVFTGELLDTPLDDKTTALSVAVADVNNDGAFDMYVSGYINVDLVEGLNIFNKEGYGGVSALLINNGDNSFTNETEERGLYYLHNTFQATFGDFERDGDLDLIVAHDTGHIRTYVNDGTGYFTNTDNPNSGQYSYVMGIGIADYNNDGFTDYVFSNIGDTPPTFMVNGDLRDDQPLFRKYVLFQPDGSGGFKDVAEEVKIADFEFGWGMSFEDLNLDGRDDLIASQNYVTSPIHKIGFLRLPGRMMVQTPNGEFAEIGAEAGVINRRYSIVPLTADFNSDGRPDVVHINIAGKSKAFLSKGDASDGFLKIDLGDGLDAIGAFATITLEDGSTLSKPYVSGEGLTSDSSHIIIAGLGAQSATSVAIRYLDGTEKTVSGSFRNETLRPQDAN
ncbi:MAG: VCBS repeat-containing protein [Litoreibacter sp.]|uniref:FG-GAP repeat domain-containing protein n=1 Tax=Litoreibacter sp. TaxID=1969459 RepID=UPI003297B449